MIIGGVFFYMLYYTLRRLLQLLIVVFIVSISLFILLKAMPGDPARVLAGLTASDDAVQSIRKDLGLNKPIPTQYFRFMSQTLTGNLKSMAYGEKMRNLLATRIPATVELGLLGLLLAILGSIPLGVSAAVWRGSKIDFSATFVALVGVSLPVFWTALVLMIVFGVGLNILPVSGRGETLYGWSFLTLDGLRHLIIPVVTIASVQLAMNTRLIRSSMLEVLNSDYIQTARSKGIPEITVIFKHAFRNALLPVLTNFGVSLGVIFAGGILTETVTAWPGVGRLLYSALTRRDQTVVFTLVIFITVGKLFAYLVVDLLYAYFDPRITYE